jgi:hypothetical protein
MPKAYGRFIVFKSEKKDPASGVVLSTGEGVKDSISIGDIIFIYDYAPLCINEDLGYFAVNLDHVVAVEKA